MSKPDYVNPYAYPPNQGDFDDQCDVCECGMALLSLVNRAVAKFLQGTASDLREVIRLVTYPVRSELLGEIAAIRQKKDRYANGCVCQVDNYTYSNLTQQQCQAMGGTWHCAPDREAGNGNGGQGKGPKGRQRAK
jgi:hypothetical protein